MPHLTATPEAYSIWFRHGLVGEWESDLDARLGTGFSGTGLMGSRLLFRADGTGLLESWGVMSGEETGGLRWCSVGVQRMSVTFLELDVEPEVSDYEFVQVGGAVLLQPVGGYDFLWGAHSPLRLVGD